MISPSWSCQQCRARKNLWHLAVFTKFFGAAFCKKLRLDFVFLPSAQAPGAAERAFREDEDKPGKEQNGPAEWRQSEMRQGAPAEGQP
jgi:hypothetical protein